MNLFKTMLLGKDPRRTLLRAVILAAFCFLLFKFLLIPIRIQGMSMAPAYRDGSINFVNTLSLRIRSPERGDIVAITIGSGRNYMYLKRIVGLPNEKVSFRDGRLFIDGEEIPEPYMKYECDWTMEEVLVGGDEFYVVGDNRSTPIETHEQGRVLKGRLRGVPLW